MKQPTHFFNLEARKTKSEEHLIFFNLSYGFKKASPKSDNPKYEPLRISTSWKIKKEYWIDKPTYRANQSYTRKYGKDLNNYLDKIERISYDQLSIFRNTHGRDPNVIELKQVVLEKLDRIQKISKNINIAKYIEDLIVKKTDRSKSPI